MTRHLVVVAVLAELTLVIATVGLAVLRHRERRRPNVLFDILPSEGGSADLRAWTLLYRSLYAISYPLWKRLLYGQPWIVFELWSRDGDLGARCWA
ncbi:MAG: hypothetical protein WCC30_15190, partial [Candidatus Dormiibacterota bacterium]